MDAFDSDVLIYAIAPSNPLGRRVAALFPAGPAGDARLIAQRAASLGARYNLRAADAVHLATAVSGGADRFLTNNRSDFPQSITEVDVVYPDQLPDPGV